MNFKEFTDRALFALSVPKCVSCGERLDYGQKAFCPGCYAEFEDFKHRNCSRCSKILSQCSCNNDFLASHFIKKTVKCFRYLSRDERSAANSLIFSLKRDNRADVLSLCADELEGAINNSIDNPKEYIFTNIPRRKAAIIEFGIDHSALLASELAKRFNASYIPILSSNAKRPQKSLDKEARFKNLEFIIKKDTDLAGKSVIIVDDVITSGASMATAAAIIRSMGCKNIVAACLGVAYKDN